MALHFKQLPVEKMSLTAPPLEDIALIFRESLSKNFSIASVDVVDCPDLRKEPFHLASKGLGGKASVVEIGGPTYLLPSVRRDKVYDLNELPDVVDGAKFIIGAGAGPWPYTGTNCEMVINLNAGIKVENGSRIAKVVDGGKAKPIVEILNENETRCSLLANIFSCQGETGKVLKIHCKQRTRSLDFVACLRNSLAAKYSQCVGLGGVFVILNGKAKQHVMPDFSATPIRTDVDLNAWLTFYEMEAPLSAVGTFVSHDPPNMFLRLQHFHSFGKTEAGHYHYDTTPHEVEYLAYFNVAETLYRIDKPKDGSIFGHD